MRSTNSETKARSKECADLVAAISGSGEIRTYKIAKTTKSRTTALVRDKNIGSTIRSSDPEAQEGDSRQLSH